MEGAKNLPVIKETKENPCKETRRTGFTKAMAQLMPKLTDKILGKRGLAQANLLLDWPNILGSEMAASCQPEKITFPNGNRHAGILHLRTSAIAALELQHDAPRLIKRVNSYFGYAAISEVRLHQTATPKPIQAKKKREKHKLTNSQLLKLQRHLNDIEDVELRSTLDKLGRAVLSESHKSTKF